MTSLAGKVAIVTGGGSGIGEALCLKLARSGAHVVVADINAGEAGRVAAAIGDGDGVAEARTLDVSCGQDVRRLIENTVSTCGRLDYLFNNAAVAVGGEARYLTLDHWQRVLDVDLYGVLHGVLAAYPIMVRQGFGHIVNTSSAAAFFPWPANAPYCTAKHAVVGLSVSLRLEGADLGVKVSCVCPGPVRTNIYRNAVVVSPNRTASGPSEQPTDAPAKMMAVGRAAELILSGVARNDALIVFPASMRWGRIGYTLFPRLIEREFLRQYRQRHRHR
jgi:NAD(P)-dependent dehydrogenase (short-subunit alcohol dehydrogenase family)